MSLVDRKATNGKGTSRIESGGGELSNVVQDAKHTAKHLSELTGEFPRTGVRYPDGPARENIKQYAEHNVQDIRSSAKGVRAKSDTKTPSPGKKPAPPAPSAKEAYITAEALRMKKGGEAIR